MDILFIKNTAAECLLCFLNINIGTELFEFLLYFFFTLYSLKWFVTYLLCCLYFPFAFYIKKKKCFNWLVSYNSKILTFLTVLVSLVGVGKGAEPSTVWARLGCYSVSWKHSWGLWVWGKRKINIHHQCAILFHSFLREPSNNQHCGLHCSLHAARPSLSLRINAAPSSEHSPA